MQLFYNPEITNNSTQFSFNKEESKHIIKVLRKGEGDTLNITNGNGWLFKAEIIVADIKKCVVKIITQELQKPKNYYLHMVVAPTKMNDRYEWFLEKATEIGVDEITPIICDHSERKVIKPERFEKIIQSAMKQSLNCYLPKLNKITSLQNFLEQNFEGQLFIAHCENSKKSTLKTKVQDNQKATMLIGPEGDFSSQEIDFAIKKDFIPVSLGITRLRTETAAIVACHTIALINE